MFDVRTVNFDDIYVEESKLRIGETFVADNEYLGNLPDEERQTVVNQVAKMVTAAEVYIFDGEIGMAHVNCQVYELEDGEQMGILLAAEKTEDGILSDVAWVSPYQLLKHGFSREDILCLGFSSIV